LTRPFHAAQQFSGRVPSSTEKAQDVEVEELASLRCYKVLGSPRLRLRFCWTR